MAGTFSVAKGGAGPAALVRRRPWFAVGAFVAVHALTVTLAGSAAPIASLSLIVLLALFAAWMCLGRARDGGARGWRMLALAMLLWATSMLANIVVHLALGRYVGDASLCLLFYVLYGVPLIFAAASPDAERWPVRLVDAALAVSLGLLFFVHTFALSTIAGAKAGETDGITLMIDIENALVALFAAVRYMASSDSRNRNFFGTVAIYGVVYLINTAFIDRTFKEVDFGTPVDLLVDLPMLLLILLVASPAGSKAAVASVPPWRERIVQATSPLMVPAMLLVVAAKLLPSYPGWAVTGFAMATLVYGLRNVLTHLRNLEERDRLERLSHSDDLTGLPNRRSFDDRIRREWLRARHAGHDLSLLMIDIDHFKLLNDHLGHVEGDRRLRDVAVALAGCAPTAGELVARYGGEEFAVILPAADLKRAIHLAEKMRVCVHELALPSPAPGGRVSISIGIGSAAPAGEDSADALLSRADAALYAAKRSGRNAVRSHLAA